MALVEIEDLTYWYPQADKAALEGVDLQVERGEFRRFGQTLTPERDYDGPPDRPVPLLKDRKEISEPAQTHTLDEWKSALDARRKIFGSGYGIVEEIEDPSKKTGVKKVGK